MFNTTEKKERSLGVKLGLKADRCASGKCAMVRREVRPGQHGAGRRRPASEYASQLREMQKFKYTYGLRAAYLKNTFRSALEREGVIGSNFIELLERRFDNVLYRMGFAASRAIARQLIGHGHVAVNGVRTTIPSRTIKKGDTISFVARSKEHPLLRVALERLKQYQAPSWLTVDSAKMTGVVVAAPRDIEIPFDVNLVVDYYSKMVK